MHTFTFTHTHAHTYTQKSKKKTKCGGIAQLEERALCKREAPGSKPGTSTIQNKNIYICVLD